MFKDKMKNINYYPSAADPCLLINHTTTKKFFVIICVDNGGIFSTIQNIDELLKALSRDFKVKYLGKLEISWVIMRLKTNKTTPSGFIIGIT